MRGQPNRGKPWALVRLAKTRTVNSDQNTIYVPASSFIAYHPGSPMLPSPHSDPSLYPVPSLHPVPSLQFHHFTRFHPLVPSLHSVPSPAMVYRTIHGHHSGFFTRQPHDWNIRDFIRYSLKTRKADLSERIILGCWNNTLWKISTCSRKDCCGKHRRTRARELYQAYHEGVRFASIIHSLLLSGRPRGPLMLP
jgi:hypothetical protein